MFEKGELGARDARQDDYISPAAFLASFPSGARWRATPASRRAYGARRYFYRRFVGFVLAFGCRMLFPRPAARCEDPERLMYSVCGIMGCSLDSEFGLGHIYYKTNPRKIGGLNHTSPISGKTGQLGLKTKIIFPES